MSFHDLLDMEAFSISSALSQRFYMPLDSCEPTAACYGQDYRELILLSYPCWQYNGPSTVWYSLHCSPYSFPLGQTGTKSVSVIFLILDTIPVGILVNVKHSFLSKYLPLRGTGSMAHLGTDVSIQCRSHTILDLPALNRNVAQSVYPCIHHLHLPTL